MHKKRNQERTIGQNIYLEDITLLMRLMKEEIYIYVKYIQTIML